MLKFSLYIRRLIVIIAILFAGYFIQNGHGQTYSSPLDIPLVLSSNFGELRPDMFHFGLDITTMGITGLNVYSIDSGYLSRIKVETGGYGRALYITHPNGYVSVYAHLLCFQSEIDSYCKNEQYRRRSQVVDLILNRDVIKIHKGQLIAWSGSAGNTTGPHLHMEIREEKTQTALNILKLFNFGISDTIPPVVEKLWIYSIGDDSSEFGQLKPMEFKVMQSDSGLVLLNSPVPEVSGKIAFGIETYDLLNKSLHKTGVYDIKLTVDGQLIFEQEINKLSWDEMRYVNSLMDYGHYVQYGEKINRLFIQPNNNLRIYKNVVDKGIINIVDTSHRKVQILVRDAALNETKLSFIIKGKSIIKQNSENPVKIAPVIFYYNKENTFENRKIKLNISSNSLYGNLIFNYKQLPSKRGYYSEIHQISNPYIPLHKSATLSVKPFQVPEKLKNKLLLVKVDEYDKIQWCGGEYKNGYIQASILSFGNFSVAIDTIPPIIIPVKNNIKNDNYSDQDQIQFIVKDNLSGINTYNGFIDGKWALFEYEAKENMLYYQFDPQRIQFNMVHTLYLEVTDRKGNVATYISTFYK